MKKEKVKKPLSPQERKEADKIIEQSVLMDDALFSVCLNNNVRAVQRILRIILEDEELTVQSARTQKTLRNTIGRSVCLDIKAEDADGKQFSIEIQKDPGNASLKKARYHASMLDVSSLQKGQNFEQLPDTIVIFITETDVLKDGLPVYTIGQTIQENGKRISTGSSHLRKRVHPG